MGSRESHLAVLLVRLICGDEQTISSVGTLFRLSLKRFAALCAELRVERVCRAAVRAFGRGLQQRCVVEHTDDTPLAIVFLEVERYFRVTLLVRCHVVGPRYGVRRSGH